MAVVFLKKNLFLNFFSHGHYPTFVGVTWSFLRFYLSRRKSGTFFIGKKSPTPFCFSGCSIAQPSTSIGKPPEKGGLINRFVPLLGTSRLPLHAHSPTPLKKGLSVCGGWSRPQHRHPVNPKKNRVSFGVFELHFALSSIATGLCSFF